MADGGDIVLGEVARATLSAILTALHRGGFGNVTRVLDPERGEVTGQLRRAGVVIPADFALAADGRVVVMISASARAATALDLLRRGGAEATWTASRSGALAPPLFGDLATRSRRAQPVDPLAD